MPKFKENDTVLIIDKELANETFFKNHLLIDAVWTVVGYYKGRVLARYRLSDWFFYEEQLELRDKPPKPMAIAIAECFSINP